MAEPPISSDGHRRAGNRERPTAAEIPESPAVRVLVLAGQRSGQLDPLARARGVSHKCLVPVLGQPMIGRVLETITEALPGCRILVSVEQDVDWQGVPVVAQLIGNGTLRFVEARPNIVDSIMAAGEAGGFPLLITTADNVLLTAQAIHSLVSEGTANDAAAIVVLARKEAIEAAHPDGKGRYYEFRNGGFSNCNLFWIGSGDAIKAAEVFRGGGQFLKVRGRLLKTFGLLNLVLFRFKLITLEQACARISRRFGVKIRPLVLDDGRLAIDVDDERSLRMTEEILGGSSR